MPSRPTRTSSALAALALVPLTGCDLLSGVPSGMIVGEIRYDGRPAPGVTVRLQTYSKDLWTDHLSNGAKVTSTSDLGGQYRFERLKAGNYRVRFDLSPVIVGGTQVGPKHVGTWSTHGVNLGGGGARLAPFDVAYNGVIYPESGKSNTYSKDLPLPFHWSTHREGNHYRVNLYDVSGGVLSSKARWQSDWTDNPVTTLNQGYPKGNYRWEVEIDGGGSGVGTSEQRNVDLDFLGTPPATSS